MQVAVAEGQRMAAFLSGLNAIFHVMHQFEAYVQLLCVLDPSVSTSNLERSLVRLHTHVLEFLAKAIHFFEESGFKRWIAALWEPDAVERFEQECKLKLEEINRHTTTCNNNVLHQLDVRLQDLARIQDVEKKLEEILKTLILSKFPSAPGATFDSNSLDLYSTDNIWHRYVRDCHPGTRKMVLEKIKHWANDSGSGSLFWLNGPAGIGKSTISRTLAKSFAEDGILGASFFFKANEKERSDASKFVSTIISRLVTVLPELVPIIKEIVSQDDSIANTGLEAQLKKLIRDPFLQLEETDTSLPILIVVIDALDECKNDDDIEVIFKFLKDFKISRLKFLITTRAEPIYKFYFKELDLDEQYIFQLDRIPKETIYAEILAFLETRLTDIRRKWDLKSPETTLPTNWPPKLQVKDLTEMSVPLFLFASTVCFFLDKTNPESGLDSVLRNKTSKHLHWTDKLYLPILERFENGNDFQNYHSIIGSLVTLAEPLPETSLENILQFNKLDMVSSLEYFHSVFNIPSRSSAIPITLHHITFREYLLDPRKRGKGDLWQDERIPQSKFWIDDRQRHKVLFEKSLQMLRSPGRFKPLGNICSLEPPGIFRDEIDEQVIKQCISVEFRYVCRYWVHHLEHSGENICDGDDVHKFLEDHLIHWLEVLCLTGNAYDSVDILECLRNQVKVWRIYEMSMIILTPEQDGPGTKLSAFLFDAKLFMLQNYSILNKAPLQIYSSALVFAPQNSIIREKFCRLFPKWLTRLPHFSQTWNRELIETERPDSNSTPDSNSVVFSADSKLVAVWSSRSSNHTTICISSTETGKPFPKLSVAEIVYAAAFTMDGERFRVISTQDELYKVSSWKVVTGKLLHSFLISNGYQESLTGGSLELEGSRVALSADGELLAVIPSYNAIHVQVWCPRTEKKIKELPVCRWGYPLFSPDGKFFVLNSIEQIELWETSTWVQLTQFDLPGRLQHISTEGKLVLSDHQDVVIMDPITKEEERITIPDRLHNARVRVLATSTSKTLLVLLPFSEAILLFDRETKAWKPRLEKHSNILEWLAVSPDGKLILSKSYNRTILLWDLEVATQIQQVERQPLIQKLPEYASNVYALAFSSDDKLFAYASKHDSWSIWILSAGSWEIVRHITTNWPENDTIGYILFSPDKKCLLTMGKGHETVMVWNIKSGELVMRTSMTDSFYPPVFSPDGELLALNRGPNITVFRVRTGEGTFEYDSPIKQIDHTPMTGGVPLAISPNNKLIALEDAKRLFIFDIETKKLAVDTIVEAGQSIFIAAFSPNGRFLAFAQRNPLVGILAVETSQIVVQIKLSKRIYSRSLRFSNDSQRLHTGHGILNLPPKFTGVKIEDQQSTNRLWLQDEWITKDGKRLIWIPEEYRSDFIFLSRNLVSLWKSKRGESGELSFIEFKF
jgi:WD40 repeat protein